MLYHKFMRLNSWQKSQDGKRGDRRHNPALDGCEFSALVPILTTITNSPRKTAMRLKLSALIASICLLLAGCQSVPYYEKQPQFSPAPPSDKGRLLISRFDIPKADVGLLLYALFAPPPSHSTLFKPKTSVYDVTDEVHYLGTMTDEDYGTWLEYDARPGIRTLMLTRMLSQLFPSQEMEGHTDFVEVDVRPGAFHHVAVSRFGFRREMYLGQLLFEERHREACLDFTKMDYRARNESIETYMVKHGIPSQVDTFKYYCRYLSHPFIIKPNADALAEFDKAKPVVEALRKKNHDAWKRDGEKVYDTPYDVARPNPHIYNEDGSIKSTPSDVADFPR